MLDINDFDAKQIIVYMPHSGDKISYRNDNMIITGKDGEIRYQQSCYRIFAVLVIGDCSVTTGLLRRANKFCFSICFLTYSFRFYTILSSGLQGNNMLHRKQYEYEGTSIAKVVIFNKILNQRNALAQIRNKSDYVKEGIKILDSYLEKLKNTNEIERDVLLGIEGNAAKVYFPRIFDNSSWKSRKPRIKSDYINSLLDIGYTILFNFIEALLHVYDFDVYEGIFHTSFYMRKSLVCDLMEPFRPIIDMKVRKGINLKQFKEDDFVYINNQWQLEYKNNALYSTLFMNEILDSKSTIFVYIRSYYRAFMKMKGIDLFPVIDLCNRKSFIYKECIEGLSVK